MKMYNNYCDACWCAFAFHTLGEGLECMNGDCNMVTYGFGVCSEFVAIEIDLYADDNK